MRYHSHFNTAIRIIEQYDGKIPFAIYLKQFFAADKKYGSKDRKSIAAFCYNYFRVGKAAPNLATAERMALSAFILDPRSAEMPDLFVADWQANVSAPVQDKLALAGITTSDIFPWAGSLSEGIDATAFTLSFLQQPDLFLRVRPGKATITEEKLEAAGIAYTKVDSNTIALSNATNITNILEPDREVVIQDLNSQQVLDFFSSPAFEKGEKGYSVWDCCAASGGKSILIHDILHGNIRLTVSDIRESILANLRKRFDMANIRMLEAFTADLSRETGRAYPAADITICDAPCTGSGTWSRTPEQLYYFDPAQIDIYAQRQQAIVATVIPAVPINGYFVYITCSAFKKENEELVNFIKEKFHLQLLQMELLKGYDKKADTMFVAVFRKPLA